MLLNSTVYHGSFLGLWFVLFLLFVQWCVASASKAMQPGAIPGNMPAPALQYSFVFRAHRTFHNSLENSPLFAGTFFLAVISGTNPAWVSSMTWLFFAGRLLYTICYYCVATERNPSLRTWFFLCGVIANILLLIMSAMTLFGGVT